MNSTNKRAENIVGKRIVKPGTIIFDEPCELGYHCPKCEYPQEIDWERTDVLERSEYNGFIRCSLCNKDYPSCFCMPDMDKAIDVYLDFIEHIKTF